MAGVEDIFKNYRALIDYCDAFWKKAVAVMPGEFACRSGCSICCELPSVNYCEALVIADYCERHPAARSRAGEESSSPEQEGSCPFLCLGRCGIYEARPLICRTHGLMLKGESFREPVSISCPYNFTGIDLDAMDRALVLDIEKVSDNLARLNAALCILLGDVKKSSERIMLRDLAEGTITRSYFNL
jgi:Fe-S-cluster containining protein